MNNDENNIEWVSGELIKYGIDILCWHHISGYVEGNNPRQISDDKFKTKRGK